ncbi:MAG: AraC family transcriptional regulator, partial [Lachnospiraceae bacterium]
EIIYMVNGSTTHIINDKVKVILEKGDLLFLNQHTYHKILPAGIEDIGINFIVLPEFFDVAFSMLEEENELKNFLVDTLRRDTGKTNYLHFHVAGVLPIQNLIENMTWSILNHENNRSKINQTTMGLLFLQLMNYTNKLEHHDRQQFENRITLNVLHYIEVEYKNASLSEIAELEGQSIYQLSRLIKNNTGYTFKELLQIKRFNKAVQLLSETRLSVSDIIAAVGYDNTSYFYRVFRERYHMSPNEFRKQSANKRG